MASILTFNNEAEDEIEDCFVDYVLGVVFFLVEAAHSSVEGNWNDSSIFIPSNSFW